jgi:spore maturation protein CgeB
MEQFLEPGREVLIARSGDEVRGHLERLTGGAARALGAAARRRILAHHTYAQRAREVDRVLRGLAPRLPHGAAGSSGELAGRREVAP